MATAKKVKRKPITAMVHWLNAASAAERKKLAKLADTAVNQEYQIAGGHRTPSAELAIKLERASVILNKANKKLPILKRESLAASSCGICEFARQCRSK